ncbi:MAG: radical SAM protein [Candidatus Lokiarchaeota archaeon]|nr:radical SAM protein [Candidatus Harpocratesius repetitus]
MGTMEKSTDLVNKINKNTSDITKYLTELNSILEMKAEMLCNGLEISESTIKQIQLKGISFDFGRKGGAGPAGGRYFKFSNGSISNTPLYLSPSNYPNFEIVDITSDLRVILKRKETQLSINNNKLPHKEKSQNGQNSSNLSNLELYLIPTPKFYSLSNKEGIPFKKIALMHGNHTLATTVHQRCRYWRGNQQCKFCGLELSLEQNATIEFKTAEQIIETITMARKENPEFVRHLTLTIGTQPELDKGMRIYQSIVQKLHQQFPNIPIHIQIEPMQDVKWYQILKDVGTSTIGIHLEILDDIVRQKMCPGKSKITKEVYYQHWKEAVRVFEPNQVSTFIITGFEKDIDKFKQELDKILQIGVLPVITPVRIIPGTNLSPHQTDVNNFLEILRFAAKKCIEYNLDPRKNVAGCIRCGGCSPLIDAYKIEILREN